MSSINGIDNNEIAETVRAVAAFIKSKNIGQDHNNTADEWIQKGGLADQIKSMDQPALDQLFAGSLPGDLRPTLMDFQEALNFFSYRETLESKPTVAQTLLDRVEAFEGFSGMRHASISSYNHEATAFINAQPRHPDERYEYHPTGTDYSDDPKVKGNTLTDWTRGRWFPESAEYVFCKLHAIGNGSGRTSKYEELTKHKEWMEEGLRALGVPAGEVSVEATLGPHMVRMLSGFASPKDLIKLI